MEIIDAQIHDAEPWTAWGRELIGDDRLGLSCELALAAMDAVGVDIALVNEVLKGWGEFAVRIYPERFFGVMNVDHNRADIAEHIAVLGATANVVGVRTIYHSDDQSAEQSPPSGTSSQPTYRSKRGRIFALNTDGLRAGRYDKLFRACGDAQLVVFMPVGPSIRGGNVDVFEEVLGRHPETQFVLDHLGLVQPPFLDKSEDYFAPLSDVMRLARYPHVALKFTGVVTLSREPYPHEDVWGHLRPVISAFGPERLMWGSDYTRLRMRPGQLDTGPRSEWVGLYSDSVSLLRDTKEFSDAEKETVFSGTARRLLNLSGGSR